MVIIHPHDVQKPKIIDFENLIKEISLNNGIRLILSSNKKLKKLN